MRNAFFWFFILMACCYTQWGKAQERIFVIDSARNENALNDFTYFLEENSQSLKPENLLESAFFEQMELFGTHSTPIKANSNYWYKVMIHNPLKSEIDFVLEIADFSTLEFYVFNTQKQLIRHQKTGRAIPFSQRAWRWNTSGMPITIPYQDTLTFICRGHMKKAGTEQFADIRLNLRKTYIESLLNRIEPKLFFYGAMTLMFFYNLFFFFMVRDRAYLYYTLYILSMLTVSFDHIYTITRQTPYLTDFITNFSAFFVTILYTQFIRYFLNIADIRPALNRYCNYWIYARVVFTIVVILSYRQSLAAILNNELVLLVFISDIFLGLFLIFTAWKANPTLAGYLVFGYLAMVLPLFSAILKQIFSTANPDTDGVIVQAGVFIELILFSLGLGYRSKLAEKEKVQAAEENRQLVQNQNVMLEKKVEERTEELNTSLSTVSKQRDDIVSSINYALRIQKAIIPQEAEIQKHFPESFVFFRPKDIVSGDFYWFADKGDTKIIAVADCTGHGVSGAFMTMIGNNILNQIVHDQEVYEPDEILNLMPILLEKTLSHAEGKVKDGMDISIISIKTLKNAQGIASLEVAYAGAMNPLFYIQNHEFFIIKADKVPVGGKQKEGFSYQKHEIALHGQSTFYLLSDGFQDQFGGEEDKKFMVKNFKNLLFEISEKPMAEQKQILTQTFDAWKGQRKQTDDVLVMGLRLQG